MKRTLAGLVLVLSLTLPAAAATVEQSFRLSGVS
jgi:hypothetical protein